MGTLKNDVERMRALIEKVKQEHEDLLPEVARDYDPIVNRFLHTYEDAFTERPNHKSGSVTLCSEWVGGKYVSRLSNVAAELESFRDYCERAFYNEELLCAVSAAFATVDATINAIRDWVNCLDRCTGHHKDALPTLYKSVVEHDYEAVYDAADDGAWLMFEQDYEKSLRRIVDCACEAKCALGNLQHVISEMQLMYPIALEFEEDVDALLNDCINIAEAQIAVLKDKPNLRFGRFWLNRIETLIEFVGSTLLPKLPNVLEFIRDNHKAAPKEMLDGLPTSADFAEALGTTLVGED